MNKVLKLFWPIGIICIAWIVFAFPYWGKGLVPFPSTYLVTFFAPWSSSYGMPVKNNAMPDVITQIFPWKRVTIDAWKHGELPLWNPYSFSGTTHAGNYQSAVFSPVNLLFALLPEIHAWSIMILLQPLLAGVFMYVFLRSLFISREGSSIGSVAFMFCGFMVVWAAYGTLSYAVLFLPLILYGMNMFMQTGRYRWSLVTTIGLLLSFLSGHFQMSLYVLLYAFSYLLIGVKHHDQRKRVISLAVFMVFGILLSLPQILPAVEVYGNAVRSGLFLKGEVIPWQYIVTFFSPDFYGNPVTRNDWFGHYAEWAGFVGVVPLMLVALVIFMRKKGVLVSFFIVSACLSLFLAFQTPLVDVLFAMKIPVLSTSSASRIIVLLSFSLAVLSGFGMDALLEYLKKKTGKPIVTWAAGIVASLLVLWVVLLVFRPLPPEKLAIAIRNTYLPSMIAVVALGVVAAGLWMPKRFATMCVAIFMILAAADSVRFASKWMPFDPQQYVYPRLPVVIALQHLTGLGHERVFGNVGNELGSAFGIQLIEGYDAVYQHRYGRFISSVHEGKPRPVDRSVVVFDKHGLYAEKVLQLLGVRYYVHKKSDGRLPWAYPFWEMPQYNRVWEDEHFEILENTSSLPRVFLASSYVVARDEQEILDHIFSSDFDIREKIVLEEHPAIEPKAGSSSAALVSYRPSRVSIAVTSSVPKLLFLSDTFDSGWKASIDGAPTRILRADFDFRAVAVPPGTHTVTMWYAPVSESLGLAVAGFATLIMAGILIRKRNI